MEGLEQGLRSGLLALALALDDTQVGKLLNYLGLLQQWNKVYNLTAVREPAAMLSHHLLDSLAAIGPMQRYVQQHKQGAEPKVLDVGSGGGLPGVVIAICCPQWRVDCVDTVAKKAAFVQQAALNLALPNLRGVHNRVEKLSGPYDVIVARAFASLPDFTTWSAQALAPNGVWLALKGKHPADEMAALPPSVQVFQQESLQVPGLDAERCLVWMRQQP